MEKGKKYKTHSTHFRTNELGEEAWIVLSVAYSELKNMDIFEMKNSLRLALKICEEYANDGIDILENIIKNNPDFSEYLLDKLFSETS